MLQAGVSETEAAKGSSAYTMSIKMPLLTMVFDNEAKRDLWHAVAKDCVTVWSELELAFICRVACTGDFLAVAVETLQQLPPFALHSAAREGCEGRMAILKHHRKLVEDAQEKAVSDALSLGLSLGDDSGSSEKVALLQLDEGGLPKKAEAVSALEKKEISAASASSNDALLRFSTSHHLKRVDGILIDAPMTPGELAADRYRFVFSPLHIIRILIRISGLNCPSLIRMTMYIWRVRSCLRPGDREGCTRSRCIFSA
jgi:hypothetical protein